MAATKISALTAPASLGGTESIPYALSGANGRTSPSQLAGFVVPANRPTSIGVVGDSVGAMFWNPDDYRSPLFWAQNSYTADLVFPTYNNTSSTPSAGQIGGVTGSPSSSLNSAWTTYGAQIAQLQSLATKPDVLFIQSLQNDFINTASNAATFAANVTSFVTAALAAGVKLCVVTGRLPKTESGSGIPSAIRECNRIIQQFCAITPGALWFDTTTPTQEVNSTNENNGASSFLPWRNGSTAGTGYSSDGTHPSALSGRALASYLVPILKMIARPVQPRLGQATLYDSTNFPFGNVLGRNGLMMGTAGSYNGSANANVAGAAATDGTFPNRIDAWTVSDNNGIVVTPTIVTGADGFPRQRLTFSGTATANATITYALNSFFALATANWSMEALLDFNAAAGLSGFSITSTSLPVPLGDTTFTSNLPTLTESWFMKKRSQRTGSASGGSTNPTSIKFYFRNGQAASGSVDIGRVGLFRES